MSWASSPRAVRRLSRTASSSAGRATQTLTYMPIVALHVSVLPCRHRLRATPALTQYRDAVALAAPRA